MKSREGTVVDADDLLSSVVQEAKLLTGERGHLEGMNNDEVNVLCNKIGKSGLKYFLLKVDPKKSMTFDPKESIDLNGHTGPYIQYGFARITSLIEKFSDISDFNPLAFKLSSKELEVVKMLSIFPENLIHAAKEFSPSILANYLYGLVKVYNSFYQDSPVIKEENNELRLFRIQLSSLTAKVIEKGMNILGIEMPKRM
jgi:arginyl-tRNA synthetase